jgi:hypothetical protein
MKEACVLLAALCPALRNAAPQTAAPKLAKCILVPFGIPK